MSDITRPMSHDPAAEGERAARHDAYDTREPAERRMDADDIKREIHGPREVVATAQLDVPHLPEPPGGRHIPHEIRRELLDCIVDSVRNMVWILNDSSDRRGSADDLELVSAEIHDASEDDRRVAKVEKVEVVPTRLERARQELRGAHSELVFGCLVWEIEALQTIKEQVASALALLEEVGR